MRTTAEVKAVLPTGTAGGFAVFSVVMPDILEALVPASSMFSADTARPEQEPPWL